MSDDSAGQVRRGSRWRIAGWSLAGGLLLLPFVAMRFTEEVAWGPEDFLVAAILIGGTGLLLELAVRRSRDTAYRAGAGVALAASFLLIWLNLAVGIIGSEDNPLNKLYAGVLAIGCLGSLAAGFRPRAMAVAFAAAAAAQMLVSAIALYNGYFTLVLDGFFAALWLTSAWLFRRAAEERAAAGGRR